MLHTVITAIVADERAVAITVADGVRYADADVSIVVGGVDACGVDAIIDVIVAVDGGVSGCSSDCAFWWWCNDAADIIVIRCVLGKLSVVMPHDVHAVVVGCGGNGAVDVIAVDGFGCERVACCCRYVCM